VSNIQEQHHFLSLNGSKILIDGLIEALTQNPWCEGEMILSKPLKTI